MSIAATLSQPKPDLVLQLQYTTAIVQIRCVCGRRLYDGQIVGVIRVVCQNSDCKKLVQVEPGPIK